MQNHLIPMLECPACHGEIHWTIGEHNGEHIEEAEVRCRDCRQPIHCIRNRGSSHLDLV